MLLEEVNVCIEDVAEAGQDAELRHWQEKEARVMLQEPQAFVYGVEEQGLQVVLGALRHVAGQAVQPGLHKGTPAKVNWVLSNATKPVTGNCQLWVEKKEGVFATSQGRLDPEQYLSLIHI